MKNSLFLLGWLLLIVNLMSSSSASAVEPVLRLSEVVKEAADDTRAFIRQGAPDSEKLNIRNEAIITEKEVKEAEVIFKDEHWSVLVTFTPEGASKFETATEKLIGKQIAILAQGKLVSAPILMAKISGGTVVISGNFKEDEVHKLAKALK